MSKTTDRPRRQIEVKLVVDRRIGYLVGLLFGLVVLLLCVLLVPEAAEPLVLVSLAALLVAVMLRALLRAERKMLIASVAALAALAWLLVAAPGATFSRTHLKLAGFARVENGMDLEQVKELLGGSPGNYGRFSGGGAMTLEGFPGPVGSEVLLWSDDANRFEIAFVRDRVVAKHQRASYSQARTVGGRLKRILEFRAVGPPSSVDFTNYPKGDDPRPPPPTAPPGSERSVRTISIPPKEGVVAAELGLCTPELSEFGTGIKNGSPTALVSGLDGALWFTDWQNQRIGRITTTGETWSFKLGAKSHPNGIELGPNGAIWFTDSGRSSVSRLEMNGRLSEFPLPTRTGNPMGGEPDTSMPTDIVKGPDGALWLLETSADKLARVTIDGKVTEYGLPDRDKVHSNPEDIEAGPDGALWFTVPLGDQSVRRFDPRTRSFNETRIPPSYGTGPGNIGPVALASSAEGIWFTWQTNSVGRIGTPGAVTRIQLPGEFASAQAITQGSDGNIWILDSGERRVIVLSRSGRLVRSYAVPKDRDFAMDRHDSITIGPDRAMWFLEPGVGKIGRIGCPL